MSSCCSTSAPAPGGRDFLVVGTTGTPGEFPGPAFRKSGVDMGVHESRGHNSPLGVQFRSRGPSLAQTRTGTGLQNLAVAKRHPVPFQNPLPRKKDAGAVNQKVAGGKGHGRIMEPAFLVAST